MIKFFKKEKCNFCGDCFVKCQYLGYDKEKAIAEIKNLIDNKESSVLTDCVTCYACNEYCPTGANPFYLIVQRQEEHDSLPLVKEAKDALIQQFEPPGLTPIDTEGKPVMSICAFANTHGKMMKGQLFDNLTLVRGRNFFCNLLYLHTAQDSVIKKRAQIIINNLASFKVPEITFFHDECYAFTTKYAPSMGIKVPFKSIHIYEHLLNYLKKNPDKIKKIGKKIAFQRSCSNRLNPEVDTLLDEIFEIVGVERVAREYDRLNALCCTAPMVQALNKKDMAQVILKKNMDDAVKHGAEALVLVCPMCHTILKREIKKAGMKRIFISDLCRIALGELTWEEIK